MSPAPSFQSCASSVQDVLSLSRRVRASPVLSTARPTPHRSSALRDGWNRCRPRWNRLASRPLVVNPGFFRTELLTEESTTYAKTSIEDYKERNAQQHEFWKAQNGKQSGDPAKLAQALITLTSQKELPHRFIAGADAIGTAEQKVALLQQQINAYRELSTSLASP